MRKSLTRRRAIELVAGALLLPSGCTTAQFVQGSNVVFAHGVASGDPDQNRVMIWTRTRG